MVRRFQDVDIDMVMSVWLDANIEAHAFIDPGYWKDNFDRVKEMIPQAEVYVSENRHVINGFIGITGDYIAGIFVDRSARGNGIGSKLLDAAKRARTRLELEVYKKNTPAVNFYLNRGFKIEKEDIDPQTSEIEYTMVYLENDRV